MFRESVFQNRAVLKWTPQNPRKIGILLLHGYAEHARRYRTFGDRMAGEGYHVFAIEHIGHGKSPGRPGYVPSFEALKNDTIAYFDFIRQSNPDFQWIVFGHSMGGLLACHLSLDRKDQISALMLSGPLLDTPAGIPNIVKKIGRVFSKLIPTLPVIALDVEGLCREPDVIRRYRADPLVYNGKIRARTGIELEDAVFAIRERFHEFTLPMWIGHGTLDRLAMPAGSRYLFDVAPSADKEFKAYNGLYHEILNEPESEVVLHDMTFWLRKRFK